MTVSRVFGVYRIIWDLPTCGLFDVRVVRKTGPRGVSRAKNPHGSSLRENHDETVAHRNLLRKASEQNPSNQRDHCPANLRKSQHSQFLSHKTRTHYELLCTHF